MTTKSIQDCVCPMCGHVGQLQQYIPNVCKGVYYRVTHYKNKKGMLVKRIPIHRMNKKYAYTCYLGKYVVLMGYEVVLPHQVLYKYVPKMEGL